MPGMAGLYGHDLPLVGGAMYHYPISLFIQPGFFYTITTFAHARLLQEDDLVRTKSIVVELEFPFAGMLSANTIVTHGSPIPSHIDSVAGCTTYGETGSFPCQ